MQINIIMIFMALFLSVLVIVLYFFVSQIKRSKEIEYDTLKQKAMMDLVRESYEKQVYMLNKQMMSDESRWEKINHLLIEAQAKSNNKLRKDSVGTQFFNDLGIEIDRVIEKRQAFVLTPFNEIFDETYSNIKDAVASMGIPCTRGDEELKTGSVLSHIVNLMLESKIIIANIDGRNSNVYYELGIAHALGKKTILISTEVDDIPFDLKTQRILFYSTKEELKEKLLPYITSSI
ncbi:MULTISPECIES: hypothetical protein [Serratia]|uniref:hypothetical protein n=1 Tax=Serratia TaxID=613 RepID=UPI000745688F|nr:MULTISPECIES: hypothetical protein [Serratia]MBH3248921.1 hypothetical protein [Serratia marcescens]MBN5282150.1 hypothetical protein [Serratia ureilytica]MBN5373250.1 hypothetical protein [Serratia ureilytica]CUZ07669.1 Uncharacterised protein [Serratia marcescens]CUZ34090.1 Uncharacterised protein [Serratia marcescens]